MRPFHLVLTIISLMTMMLIACTSSSSSASTDDTASANNTSSPDTAPTPSNRIQPTVLPVIGTAPELENEIWLNTDHPLRLADLRGKVVALEMWTFG